MTRRVLRRGCAVFAPQLLLWNPDTFGPKYDRIRIDQQLKHLGGSITALEIYRLQRSLDYLATRPEIDAGRTGMIGLSYGGFYTLFAAAVETRIKVAVSSCFFNNRKVYDWADWTWFDAANTFMDAEVAMLVCPRRLYIEVGKKDELFNVKYALPEANKVKKAYAQLGIPERFVYHEFHGVHELDKGNGGIDFLCNGLGIPPAD
jgi:dienelactone hydrolase